MVQFAHMKALKEENIHRVFEVSIILKGIHAAIEIITSFAVLFVTSGFVNHMTYIVTQEELMEDPHDFISNYLLTASHQFSGNSQLFAFFYLFSHGIIKIFLVYYLLKNKLWAYPASMAVLFLFIIYQIYRYNITHSLGLIALTVFDLFILCLVWHEYNLIKKHLVI